MVKQVINCALSVVSAMVLARIVSPEDFGLVAMVGAVTPFLRLFREGGLSMATVQREQITHAQVSNLFWINISLGALTATVGVLIAPLLARFYRDTRLLGIALALSAAFLIGGGSVQHLAILNRQMRFKAIACVSTGSTAIGIAVGIGMACLGYGYWALVAMQLATPGSELVLAWSFSRWRPQWPSLRSETRSLLTYGASLTTSNALRRLAQIADTLLIGRFYGPASVGLYSRAGVLLTQPVDQFIAPFDTVFVPLLSRLQNAPKRYRESFLLAYNAIAMMSFPMAAMLFGLARPLVLLLLGPNWTGVIPIFAWFTIAALVVPLSYAAMWLLVTQGRSRDIMLTGMSFSAITITCVALGIPFGIGGVAVTSSLGGLLARIPVQYLIIGRKGPVVMRDLWLVVLRHLPNYVAVVASVHVLQRAVSTLPPLAQMAICGPCGLIVALAVTLAIPAQRIVALQFVGSARKLWTQMLIRV